MAPSLSGLPVPIGQLDEERSQSYRRASSQRPLGKTQAAETPIVFSLRNPP